MNLLQMYIRDGFHITVFSAVPRRKTIPSLTNETTSEILENSDCAIEQRFPKCAPQIPRDRRQFPRGFMVTITAMTTL